MEFKQSEMKKERNNLERLKKQKLEIQEDLGAFRQQADEAKKRFQATFHTEPEARETLRESEKKRIQAANRIGQADNEIKTLCEKTLPLAIAGKLFDGLRRRIEERSFIQQDVIRDHAATLTQTLIQAVEEPEPIYRVSLNAEQRRELEQRIQQLLQQGAGSNPARPVLNVSEREAAQILHRLKIKSSDLFQLGALLNEKRDLEAEIERLEDALRPSASSASERELFEQLQAEMDSCATQIGRKSEQQRLLNEHLLALEKRTQELEAEISGFMNTITSRGKKPNLSPNATP